MRRWPCVLLAVCSVIAGTMTVLAAPAGAAPAWSITASPNPPSPPTGGLNGISCSSATDCFAVGARDGLTLIERWNGTAWSFVGAPIPAGATSSALSAVSCTSAASCFAVGSATTGSTTKTLIERWNGAAWLVVASPNPSASASELNGVSCTSATNCFAVGSGNGSVVERWDGTSWTVVNRMVADSTTDWFLDSVSCASATSCLAVGVFSFQTGTFEGGAAQAFSMRWDGSTWSKESVAQPPPDPLGNLQNYDLSGVSCSSATSCMAVGSYQAPTTDGYVAQTLIEQWNGIQWALVSSPNAPDAINSDLSAVSCTSATSCTAVGTRFADPGAERTLAETWDGTTWSIAATVNAAAVASLLLDVACTSSSACVAVGFVRTSTGSGLKTLVEARAGATWSIVASPNAPGATLAGFNGVACTSATNCFAVGDGAGKPLIERWNGTTWSILASPRPVGVNNGVLNGIACPAPTSCFAVGSYYSGSTKTLVERWNGTSWAVVTSPSPAGDSILRSVACTSTTNCFAVGETTSAQPRVVVQRWNGTSWSGVAVPNPAGSSPTLTGVACGSTTSCLAVGSYQSGAKTFTLSERWNGTSWALIGSPNKAGASVSTLSGIACVTAVKCYAVGAGTVNGVKASFVLHWNGSTWAGTLSSHPAGATASDLAGVSCTSATSCFAVGDYVSAGVTKTFAQRFDGTNWNVSPTPNPAGALSASFGGVACAAGPKCVAVGQSEIGPQHPTLTERYA
jgi:hypothetical protein